MQFGSLEDFAALFGAAAGPPLLDKLEITSENGTQPPNKTPFSSIKSHKNPIIKAEKVVAPYDKLKCRANSKHLSQTLAAGLLQLARPHNPKAYVNTFFCAGFVVEEEGRFKSKYCHNRWCLVCNRIKTAYLIDKYTPFIKQWNEPYFVTLTAPNVSKKDLKARIEQHLNDFVKIKDRMRKQGQKIVGIRKFECTFNPIRRDFHPHLHILIENKAHANEVLRLWLEYYPESTTSAQDVRPADHASIKELFKYFTKITSDNSSSPKITLPALDTIFEAVKGRRVFQSFGFKTKITEVLTDEQMKFYSELCDTEQRKRTNLVMQTPFSTKERKQKDRLNLTEFMQLDKEQLYKTNCYFWEPKAGNWICQGLLINDWTATEKAKNFKNNLIYTLHEPDQRINKHRPNDKRNANPNRREPKICSVVVER